MLRLDKEMQEQLQKIIEIEDKELFNFRKHIESLYKDGNILDLQKLLGAFYTPIVRFMFDDPIKEDTQTLKAFGFNSEPREDVIEHLIKIAITFYKEEELKEYGDVKVTEALNYFMLEDGDVTNAYYQTLEKNGSS